MVEVQNSFDHTIPRVFVSVIGQRESSMGDVVASPVILLPVFPVCLTAIRDANLRSPEQIGVFRRSEFSVKEILTGDHNGDRYYYVHRQEIRPVTRAEVEKMLSCKGPGRGCFVYYCPTCDSKQSNMRL